MGLVFGALLLLWLMMAILTALTAEKGVASDSPESASPPQPDSKLQIALLAVAMALAAQKQTSARPLPQPRMTLVSAWQLGMRMKQLVEKGKITKR